MLIYNFGDWTEWNIPQKVTFLPEQKLIEIHPGETQIDVQVDLYSAWKEWIRYYDNAKWSSAFTTFGGDPTGESQYAPRYFFLTNGWKVYAKDMSVVVQMNLYSDDGLSPFIIDNAAVTNRASDVPIIKSEVEKRLDYGDRIYVNENSTYTGVEYPNGTIAQPVNNMTDAIYLANLYNIKSFYFLSDLHIIGSGTIYDSYSFYADRENLAVYIDEGNYLNNVDWTGFIIDGNFGGGVNKFSDCIIINALDVSGQMKDCQMNGTVRVWQNLVTSMCYSGIAGSATPIYDMHEFRPTTLSVRSYSGGVDLRWCNFPQDVTTIELIAGQIQLNQNCTSGYVDIRGVGYIINNSSGSTVKTTGFIDSFDVFLGQMNSEIQSSAFNNGVWIDLSGTTGTTYPIGTQSSPVNNIEDAIVVAGEHGFQNLFFVSDYTFENTVYISNFNLIGQGAIKTSFTFVPGCILANCSVSNAKLSGLSFGITSVNESYIFNYGSSGLIASNAAVSISNSIIGGNIIIPSNYTGTLTLLDCKSLGTDSSGRNNVYLNNADGEILIRGHIGTMNFYENNNPNLYLSVDILSGRIGLNSTITEGRINLRGVATLINDAGPNIILDTESFINQSTVATAVWDEQISSHLIEGSTGLAIGIDQFNGVVTIDVVNGVSGTTFPIGTSHNPVNNIADAKTIANNNGMNTFYLLGNLSLDSTNDGDNYIYVGSHRYSSNITLDNVFLNGTRFSNCTITGDAAGDTQIETQDCVIIDLHNVVLTSERCIFGGVISLGGSRETNIYNSFDLTPGPDKAIFEVRDCLGLGVWNWVGGIMLTEMTNANSVVSLMLHGRLTVDASDTHGSIIVRGTATVYGETGGAVITDEGAINKAAISQAVWDEDLTQHTIDGTTGRALALLEFGGKVWLDPTSSYSGTTFPSGTQGSPVNNGPDAILIATRENIDELRIQGIFTTTTNLSDYTIGGDSYLDDGLNFNNNIYDHITFKNLRLSGIASFTDCEFINCAFTDIHGLVGSLDNCIFLSSITNTLVSGQTIFNNCRSGVAGNNSPTFDFAATHIDLSVRSYSGGIKFLNYDDPSNTTTVEFIAGRLNLTNTCTDGYISARGVFSIGGLNLVGPNFTLDTTARAATVDSIWNENITNHLLSGSTGRALSTASSGGVDIQLLVDGVWNESMVSHLFPGSFGASISGITDSVNIIATQTNDLDAQVKRILGLSQENFRIMDHIYNADNNLDSATVRIFNSSVECDNNVNPLATYSMIALYDSSGRLVDYKVTKS